MNDNTRKVCSEAIDRFGVNPKAVEYCRGLFPLEARSVFREISGIDPYAGGVPKHVCASGGRFGLSQWYFHNETISKIEQEFLFSKKLSLCLGVPSLSGKNYKRSLLMDLDAGSVPGGVAVDIGTCNGSELPGAFDICIADPPWYLDHYIHWMRLARQYLKQGSTLLMPLLGEMTRPSASEERAEIIRNAESLGFEVSILNDFCRYQTPSFELAMLCRKGIYAPAWKRADMLVLTATKPATNVPVRPMGANALRSFVTVNDIGFEVIHNRAEPADHTFLRKPDGPKSHFMDTPSARDQFTVKCNVFTSNGFRFISDRSVELVSLLRSVADFDDLIASMPDAASLLEDVRQDQQRWFASS